MMLDNVKWEPIPPPDIIQNEDVPYATHKGTVDVLGCILRCYQLSDGRRVIDADDVHSFFSPKEPPHDPTT